MFYHCNIEVIKTILIKLEIIFHNFVKLLYLAEKMIVTKKLYIPSIDMNKQCSCKMIKYENREIPSTFAQQLSHNFHLPLKETACTSR